MSYRICRIFEIENGHMLSKHPGKCRFPHGHSRKIECVIEADGLDERGMVCDFKVVKLILEDYLDRYDHALCMNTDDPAYEDFKARYGDRIIGFPSEEPTTEVLAREIFRYLKNTLDDYGQNPSPEFPIQRGVRVISVRVWETSMSWAEYSE